MLLGSFGQASKLSCGSNMGLSPHGTWGGPAGPGSEPGAYQQQWGQLSIELECVCAFPLSAYLYPGAIQVSVYGSRYQQSFGWVCVCSGQACTQGARGCVCVNGQITVHVFIGL